MEKLLSVVIPTYNRASTLQYTVSQLLEQIERNDNDVEIIVCDNASSDNTREVITLLKESHNDLKVISYNDHVEVGDSIRRSAANAKGRFLLLWSDDDIPSPFLIDNVVLRLKQYPEIGCLCFNRIEGYSNELLPIKYLYLTRNGYNAPLEVYDDSGKFIQEYFCDMSFMSQNVINMDCWKEGSKYQTSGYYGFEFMMPLLGGLKDKRCIYLDYPLCIERHPNLEHHSYASKWPLYIYIGIPRLLRKLEELSVINDWEKCYSNYHYAQDSFRYLHYVYAVFSKNLKVYQPYKKELLSYQKRRICITYTRMALSNNFLIRILSFFFYKCYKVYHVLIKSFLKGIIKEGKKNLKVFIETA